jgi:hypothetical protein
MTEENKDGTPV